MKKSEMKRTYVKIAIPSSILKAMKKEGIDYKRIAVKAFVDRLNEVESNRDYIRSA